MRERGSFKDISNLNIDCVTQKCSEVCFKKNSKIKTNFAADEFTLHKGGLSHPVHKVEKSVTSLWGILVLKTQNCSCYFIPLH